MSTHEFMERLGNCWMKYPHLRFGQFIHNAFAVMSVDGISPADLEDADMIQYLETYIKSNTGEPNDS